MQVVDVHIHDAYDMFRFRNDIALIRVDPPFQYSHKVQAISLPPPGHRASGMAYASGWGLTQEGNFYFYSYQLTEKYFS